MAKGKLVAAVLGLVLLTGGVMFSASASPGNITLTQNATGTHDGYDYEFWTDVQPGSGTNKATMVLTGGGSFTSEYDTTNNKNTLMRTGKKFGGAQASGQTHSQIGNIILEYDVDYYPGNSGASYMCVYGWTRKDNGAPLVEYYVVESWGAWRPPGSGSKGNVTIGGLQYEIFETTRTNQPSIIGNTTFQQYWAVRTSKPAAGSMKATLNISDFFKAWEAKGMKLGTLYEVSLCIEGYNSTGRANVKKHTLTIGGEGDITNPPETTIPDIPEVPTPEGYYFYNRFNDNSVDSWMGRGAASIDVGNTGYDGTKGLSVTGRTANWNGASRTLSTATFVPGKAYSFSALVMQDSIASEDFKITLQYRGSGDSEDSYATVAEGTASKGQWILLENTNFTIPDDATNLVLYVEAGSDTTPFFMDEAIGAVKGTKNPNNPGNPDTGKKGDLNKDGKVDEADLTLLKKIILNMPISEASLEYSAGDMNEDEKLDVIDVIILKRALLKETGGTDPGETDPGDTDPTQYMDAVRKAMTNSVPSSATTKSGSNYGEMRSITYFSTAAGKNKKANVLLPAGYSSSEKYPVMYVTHGIFGDENSMIDDSWKIQTMAGNLSASGEAKKMIIVFPAMFTSKTMSGPSGMNPETAAAYDNFLYDLTDDLMPYMKQNFSILEGRENTAITGFSMGGREALYIGIMRPDLFGYIGAGCPAPGITPTTDSFMTHPGCMQESEFKIKSGSPLPYVLMITGGTNDTVVGTYPEFYHNLLTKNGTDHIWQSISGGGHDAGSVVPHMYNFIKAAFNA